MPGYYKKAPLVYVTAQLACSRFTELDSSVQNKLHKAMINTGLPDRQVSEGAQLNFNVAGASITAEQSKIHRNGFFSADKRQCLVIAPDHIEFRVSNYFKFGKFCERLNSILDALYQAVPEYRMAALREVVLSYADAIVPKQERELFEYFKEKSILPLSFLSEYENDVQQAGQTQATRIVNPDLRIAVSLEQLPVINKQVWRWLPQAMYESDPKLTMPLDIRADCSNISSHFYGILLTQGGKLINKTIAETNTNEALDEIHKEIKRTFTKLLNDQVCNQDWEYINE